MEGFSSEKKKIQRYFFTSTPQSFVQSKVKFDFFTFPNLNKLQHAPSHPKTPHQINQNLFLKKVWVKF